MSSLWLDVRYALRMMTKSFGLTVVLAVTLALGIGASTTIFSVVHSVVLKPLPYQQPEQLVRVYTEFRPPVSAGANAMQLEHFWVSPPEYDDFRRECRSCASVGAWRPATVSLSGGDRPIRINAAFVTQPLLPTLGVKPQLGRWFDEDEDKPGDPTAIILSYDVWKRAFAGDPTIIGRKIQLDAIPVTIVGVMPQGFDFLDRQEAWVPLRLDPAKWNRGNHALSVVTRLKPEASIDSLREEILSLEAVWHKSFIPQKVHALGPPNPYMGTHTMIAEPFQADLVGSLSTTLWLLQGAVLLVLLISIVNVANLLLARSETRTREVAVRHALGASRTRLLRQFLTESVLLGLLGGGLGILVAVWAVDGVTALIPKSAPRASEIALDWSAVGFAVLCSVAAALLFGMAPIFHARRTDLHGALKDGSPRMTGSRARLRVRRALVIAEIALAVVLVIGCTVMVRSFLRLQQVDVGFQPDHLLTFGIDLPKKTYPGVTGDVFWHRLEDRLRGLPGVQSVTLVSGLPPNREINANDISFPGRPMPGRNDPSWNVDYWQFVGDDGLETLGARIVKGRNFTRSDTTGSPDVAIINEAFAAKFFPNEDPVGKKINITPWDGNEDGKKHAQTVVGVVHDIKQQGVDKPALTEVFVLIWQSTTLSDEPESERTMRVVVRTQGDPDELVPLATRAVAELDPSLPLFQTRTMNDVMWEAVARPRFLTFLLSCFAGLALLLAAVGIYGVMAHTVAQRTHEIGVRVALGAQPRQVRAMVLRQAALLVGAGVVLGLGVAVLLQLVLDATLEGLLYGERLSQPALLAGVALAVTATALVATWIPARRATKVEPTVALRSE